jgi:hypothetical protein
MSTKIIIDVAQAHHHRRWRAAADLPPRCPGCSGELVLMIPTQGCPDELLGSCECPGCAEWGIYRRMPGGRLVLVERIPRKRRDPRSAARPAATGRSGQPDASP